MSHACYTPLPLKISTTVCKIGMFGQLIVRMWLSLLSLVGLLSLLSLLSLLGLLSLLSLLGLLSLSRLNMRTHFDSV